MSMVQETDTGRKLTGWHVLAIAVGAFGIIVSVNIFMATKAITTFPGLETKNSYVASQKFNDNLAGQRALGWNVKPSMAGETLMLMITDAVTGNPVEALEIGGILGRATHVKDDQVPEFERTMSGAYAANVGDLDFGKWELRLEAVAKDGTPFRRIVELYVPKS